MAAWPYSAIAGSTVFSQQLGLAVTRNPELASEAARMAAREMRATGT